MMTLPSHMMKLSLLSPHKYLATLSKNDDCDMIINTREIFYETPIETNLIINLGLTSPPNELEHLL
jgi:hypothetical protein